jgi:hypothetical protein
VGGEGVAQGAVGVDGALHLGLQVEVADVVDRVLDLVEVGLAEHLVDVGLELAGHAAGLLDHAGDAADGDRHVLGADQHQGYRGNDGHLRPGEIEHGAR